MLMLAAATPSEACKVVQPGQVFLRKLIDLSTKAKHPDHWVKMDAEFWVDLAWWEAFLPLWNVQSVMEIHRPRWTPTVTFSSDASESWGCGAEWQQAWFQHPWGEEWTSHHIAAKELVPIAATCAMLGSNDTQGLPVTTQAAGRGGSALQSTGTARTASSNPKPFGATKPCHKLGLPVVTHAAN